MEKVIAFGKYALGYPKCPVQIEQFKLFYSEDDRKTYICFKFVNFFDVEIKELRFNLVCFDKNRKPIGSYMDYYYSPKTSQKYSEFGYENKFEIPCYGCQTAMLAFTQVTFKDGMVWKYQDNKYPPTQKQAKAITPDMPHFAPINIELRKHDVQRIKYNPIFAAHGWLCTCGMVNIMDDENCLSCNINRYNLMDSFNEEYLEKQEKLEREKREKEIQEREAKLKKKREEFAINRNRQNDIELVEIKKPIPQKKVVQQKPIVLEELRLEELKLEDIEELEEIQPAIKPVKKKVAEAPIVLEEIIEKPVDKKPATIKPTQIKPVEKKVVEQKREEKIQSLKPIVQKPTEKSQIIKEDKQQDKSKLSIREIQESNDELIDIEMEEIQEPKETQEEKIVNKKEIKVKEKDIEEKKSFKLEKTPKREKHSKTEVLSIHKKKNVDSSINQDDLDKPMEDMKNKQSTIIKEDSNENEIIEPLDLSDWLV